MTRPQVLRLRALLARQFEVVVVVLVVLGAVGGFLAYGAYAQSNTDVQSTEVTAVEASGSFSHGSTVVDNETLTAGAFQPGAHVTNRSVYFQSVMPVLNGTFTYWYGSQSGELETTFRSRLVLRSVGQRDGERVEYWRVTRPLSEQSQTVTLAPGTRATVPYSVNVTDVVATVDRTRRRIGDPGQTRVSVNVSVGVSGNAGGQRVDRTFVYALPVTVEGDLYRIGASEATRTVTRTEEVTVADPPGPLAAYGGPVLLVCSLAGLGGVVYARRDGRFALTDAERAWLAYRDDRADFEDWLSTVRLPTEAQSYPVAEADSLADLVNVAIDTDAAVLESPEGDVYHVLHDGVRYTFTAPPEPTGAVPRADDD